MAKQYNVAMYRNGEMKLISENARVFRDEVALDLSFQSEGRWPIAQASEFMRSLVTGMATSKLIVANIQDCMDNCDEDSNDYAYFKFWADQGYKYISIDGNNRTITIENYLNGLVKLPHREYDLPNCTVAINETNDTYDKHPNGMLKHIAENVSLSVCEYTKATREDLSLIFQSVNNGIPLNKQELRNSILVPFAKWVRENVTEYKPAFKTIFTKPEKFTRRAVDEFIVSASVFTTYGPSNGINHKDRDAAYNEESSVSKQQKRIAVSLKTLCRIIGNHATPAFKKEPTFFNLYMLIDTLRKKDIKILDEEKFFKWFMGTEMDRMNDPKILCEKDNGEHRNYKSCCSSTGGQELSERLNFIMQDLNSIESGIVTQLDKKRIFTEAQRYTAWVTQEGICPLTGMKIPKEEINDHTKWHADHWFAYTYGGQTDDDNCRLVQAKANLKKGSKVVMEEMA